MTSPPGCAWWTLGRRGPTNSPNVDSSQRRLEPTANDGAKGHRETGPGPQRRNLGTTRQSSTAARWLPLRRQCHHARSFSRGPRYWCGPAIRSAPLLATSASPNGQQRPPGFPSCPASRPLVRLQSGRADRRERGSGCRGSIGPRAWGVRPRHRSNGSGDVQDQRGLGRRVLLRFRSSMRRSAIGARTAAPRMPPDHAWHPWPRPPRRSGCRESTARPCCSRSRAVSDCSVVTQGLGVHDSIPFARLLEPDTFLATGLC